MSSTRSASHPIQQSSSWQNAALGLCIAFGSLLIPQVQVAGDGMWFWYAKAWLAGKHLYGDLHLPLQPLYPLLIAATIKIFGTGWIAQKLLAILLMASFAFALRYIVCALPGTDLQRGLSLCFGFGMPMLFQASRFDDYHVLTDSATAWCIVLLLALNSRPAANTYRITTLLAFLCALAAVSRLNDGALLLLSVAVVLFFRCAHHRWQTLLLLFGIAAAVSLAVVWLTGDSLADWAANSIFRAASAKGGSGKVAAAPFLLLWTSVKLLLRFRGFLVLDLYVASLCLAVLLLARRRQQHKNLRLSTLLLGCTVLLFAPLARHWGWEELPFAVDLLLVFLLPVAAAYSLFQTVFRGSPAATNAALATPSLVFLLPLSQLVSGAMSSGGSPTPLTSSLGMAALLLPLSVPHLSLRSRPRLVFFTVISAMALCCFVYKWQNPFHWHSYQAKPLFRGRQVYRHPTYGPMIIEDDLLALVQPVCAAVAAHRDDSLLSLPFPYPNYFCNTPPWHGYVQTFFDISTSQTISQMILDLQNTPPAVIVYQRQIKNLETHEALYNSGKPLPHRALDEFIGSQLQSGTWIAIAQQCRSASDWITIETGPAAIQDAGRRIRFNWNPYHCDNTETPASTKQIRSDRTRISLAQTAHPQ